MSIKNTKFKIVTTTGRFFKRASFIGLFAFGLLGLMSASIPTPQVLAQTPSGPTKRVIVRYSQVLGANSDTEIEETTSGYIDQVYNFKHIPFGVYEVDAEGEQSLNDSAYVTEVVEEQYFEPHADLPIPTIGGDPTDNSFSDTTTTTQYDGSGYAVAVLDTGVDKNHATLSGKVISEACFSTNDAGAGVSSLCPGAVEFSAAADSALDCDASVYGSCGHGTTVAGAIAMDSFLFDVDADLTDDLFSGVAVGADIIALKVFSAVDNTAICGIAPGENPCVRTAASNQLQALDYLIDLDVGKPIVAANMSLGSGNYASIAECEAGNMGTYSAFASLFSQLSNINIATIISNGNAGAISGNEDKISMPACVEGAIAVGATNILGDTMASYSNNSSSLTSLLAPGGDAGATADAFMWLPEADTVASVIGVAGTSQAAPMVAGAFAVLREKHPDASVDQLLALLQDTGVDVAEVRAGYSSFSKPLINLGNALSTSTFPVIDVFTGPTGVVHEGGDTDFTITTTNVASCSLNHDIGAVNASGAVTVPGFADFEITCVGHFNDETTATFSATTFNTRPTQPSVGGTLSVDGDSEARTATISWAASTDTDGIDFYEVYLDGALEGTTSETTYMLTDLGLETEYTVEVYAVDTLGAKSLANSEAVVLGATTTPGVPDTGVMSMLGGLNDSILFSFGFVITTGAIMLTGRRLLAQTTK